MHANAIVVQGTNPAEAYAQFRAAVAQAQVTHWLTGLGEADPTTVIDISGPGTNAAELAADSGHSVLRVLPPGPGQAGPGRQRCRDGIRVVTGDLSGLEFLANGSADGVIAEDGTLSRNLAAETLVTEIARVLRPGGKVLACVDSLTLGMATLAQQSRWPHLVDLPRADVVLVPWPDGTITRCYGSEHLRELFIAAGFDVNWIRPRTVFAPRAVSYLLARDPRSFPKLLHAELHSRSDDSVGDQLIISAKRRLPSPPVLLRLAGDAAGTGRAGFQARLRHRVPAVGAQPVAAVVDADQRREHLGPLGLRGLHRGRVPVGLGQVGPSVARLRGSTPGQRVFLPQHHERPLQVIAHFL